MSSFLENIRLNDDLKEKLHSASDKVLNYVNERPLWERFQNVADKNNIGDNNPNCSKYFYFSFETLSGQINSWNINYFLYLYSISMDSIEWMWRRSYSTKTFFYRNYESVFWHRYIC